MPESKGELESQQKRAASEVSSASNTGTSVRSPPALKVRWTDGISFYKKLYIELIYLIYVRTLDLEDPRTYFLV